MSNQSRSQLLALLSSGELTSGTVLGERLNISRAAVHKHVQALTRQGVPIHRVPGRGYRLSQDVQLLDATLIRGGLDADITNRLSQITVLQQVDSTNNWLLKRQPQSSIHGHVCAAEAQSRGRGRRSHVWVASPYRNVMFSIAWEFAAWPESVTGLGLAASVAVVRALHRLSVTGVGIKWPNDLLFGGAKLGGILIDINGESAGKCLTVIGIGINVHLEESDAGLIGQPHTDLNKVTGMVTDRNHLIAVCSSELTRMLGRFGDLGFQAFRAEWERMHVYTGRRVRLVGDRGEVCGRVSGLLIDVGNNYVKWAAVDDDRWDGGYRTAISGTPSNLFESCWGYLPVPRRIMVSNVQGAQFESDLVKWCQSYWKLRPLFLESTSTAHGIVNHYHDPKQLGPDRWAALIGARALSDGALGIIDCGTAITVDALSADNVFLGGAILPGLRLARDSLLTSTRGVNEGESNLVSVLGRSTADCVASGVYYGLAGGIDRLVNEIEKSLVQDLRLYVTGGDAIRLQPLLTVHTILEPELVLKGLSEVLNRL